MKNIMILTKREFRSYFSSPIAYIAICVYLLLIGVTFFFRIPFLVPSEGIFNSKEVDMRHLFEWSIFIFTIILPAISMRLIAEEKKLGTIELLLTMPITDFEIVAGKLLGAAGFLVVALAFTLFYPALLFILGSPDIGPILGGYFGVLLIGISYLSIGLLMSSLTNSQIVAFILTLAVCLFFAFVDRIPELFGMTGQLFVNDISFNYHFKSIARGVIDTRDIVFFLSIIAGSIALTVYSLNSRKWK